MPSTAAFPGTPAPCRGWAQIQPATDQIGKPFGEFSLQQFGSAVFCPGSACNGRPTPGICPRSACNGRPTPGLCPGSARNVRPTSEICPSPARRCTPDPWNLSELICFLSENLCFLSFPLDLEQSAVYSRLGICPFLRISTFPGRGPLEFVRIDMFFVRKHMFFVFPTGFGRVRGPF